MRPVPTYWVPIGAVLKGEALPTVLWPSGALKVPRGEGRELGRRYLWAVLLARFYEIFPLRCSRCGTEMRIIAFVTDAAINEFFDRS